MSQSDPISSATTDELLSVIKDVARTHAHLISAQSAHDRLVREIAVLKGNLMAVEQSLAVARLENLSLRKQIRLMHREPWAVGAVAGDSR